VIEAEKANYKILWICQMLNVARPSFYAWCNRVETPTEARRRELAVEVRRVFGFGRDAFGCRRVSAQLNREGHECSVGLVAELMRDLGLVAVQPRAYKRMTVPGQYSLESPDLIERDFTAGPDGGGTGKRLVGDITYLRTGEGWLYLATVIDLATRMVVGWQMSTHVLTSLITDALQMAVDAGHVRRDAIFHSDRGTQVHQPRLRAARRRSGRPTIGRAHRAVLGQRAGRELLRLAEGRMPRPAKLAHSGRSAARDRRLHRLVQRHPTAQLTRLPQPRRVRSERPTQRPTAGSLTESSTLSVKAGQPQRNSGKSPVSVW
jgi:putative transposase